MQNAAAMVRSQNDVYMVTSDAKQNTNGDNLAEALENGTLERRHLQRCAANILKMLMRSPVMERSLDRMSQEEREACEQMAEEDKVNFDIVFHTVENGKLTLDTTGICTDKGNSVMYGVTAQPNGFYTLHMKMKVDASELAQVNTSIFLDEHLIDIITLNGTDGACVEKEIDLMFFGPNHYLKFYFAQSGLTLEEVSITFKEEVKPFA
jgi:beta-glucosidase